MREGVEKHDIHIKSKSYKLELLGELVINLLGVNKLLTPLVS